MSLDSRCIVVNSFPALATLEQMPRSLSNPSRPAHLAMWHPTPSVSAHAQPVPLPALCPETFSLPAHLLAALPSSCHLLQGLILDNTVFFMKPCGRQPWPQCMFEKCGAGLSVPTVGLVAQTCTRRHATGLRAVPDPPAAVLKAGSLGGGGAGGCCPVISHPALPCPPPATLPSAPSGFSHPSPWQTLAHHVGPDVKQETQTHPPHNQMVLGNVPYLFFPLKAIQLFPGLLNLLFFLTISIQIRKYKTNQLRENQFELLLRW